MNQRIIFMPLLNQVAVDLPGHREMHACRASMPVVAPSRRVPVRLDVQREGYALDSRTLSQILSLDSGDFRRHVVIDSARILCVAGYFCSIGNSVSMSIFLSVVSFLVLPLCFCAVLLLRAFYCSLFHRVEH